MADEPNPDGLIASRLEHLFRTVIAPGSRMNGRAYEVISAEPPALLPGWIADAADQRLERHAATCELPQLGTGRAQAYAMAALRNETRRMATAVDGTRHDTLNTAAFSLGQLVGAGMLPGLAVVTSLADAASEAGLPDHDILRIIRSSMAAGIRHPRGSTVDHL